MRVTGDPGEGVFRGYCDGEVRKFWLVLFGEVYCKNSAMHFL